MAFVLDDRCRETSTAPGTGSFTMNGAVQGAQTFASALTSNADTTWYAATNGTAWETGLLTRTSATVFARTTIFRSTNGNAAVNFSTGTIDVLCDVPGSKAKVLERLAWSAGAILSVGDGTVSLPAWSFSNDPDCGLYRIGANNLGLAVNGAKVLDIGTAGLGVTGTLSVSSDFAINTNKLNVTASNGNTSVAGTLSVTGKTNITGNLGVGIDADTLPGVGNTSLGFSIVAASGYMGVSRASGASIHANTNADGNVVAFFRSGTQVGSVGVTTTTTAYNTTSDRECKDDERLYTSAREVIDAIRIYDFRWKGTDQRGVGVFAQEVYRVFPDAITPSEIKGGWQADYSKYVPVLMADAQETHRRLAALEARTA